MGLFDWLTGKKEPAPPEMGMRGMPVHVNPNPGTKQARLRHLRRIQACMSVLSDPSISAERRASFTAEVNRRKAQMAAAGVVVPDTSAELVRLIARVEGEPNG